MEKGGAAPDGSAPRTRRRPSRRKRAAVICRKLKLGLCCTSVSRGYRHGHSPHARPALNRTPNVKKPRAVAESILQSGTALRPLDISLLLSECGTSPGILSRISLY